MTELVCPLCERQTSIDYCHHQGRRYFQCQCCQLVFLDCTQWLTAEQEQAVYDLHQNSPADTGYRKFLSRLVQPLLGKLKPGDTGLDFGCGPGPTLSVMLEEEGYPVQLYDIFYYHNPELLNRRYQFITATEVVEHLHQPGREIKRLWAQLCPGGTLGLMTKLVRDRSAFLVWHYKNDPTHVCFFSEATFNWLEAYLHAELTLIGNDVILLTKASGSSNSFIAT